MAVNAQTGHDGGPYHSPGVVAEMQRFLRCMGLHDNQKFAEHVLVMVEAAHLYMDRDAAYGDQWKSSGAIDNLRNAKRKVVRQLAVLSVVCEGKEPALSKDNLDDALDALNYLTFAIRNARRLNMDGEDDDEG